MEFTEEELEFIYSTLGARWQVLSYTHTNILIASILEKLERMCKNGYAK